MLGLWRSPEDEKLLLSLSQSCVPPPVNKASNGNHFHGNSSSAQLPGGGVDPSTSTPSKLKREIDGGYANDEIAGRFSDSDDDVNGFTLREDCSDDGGSSSSLSEVPKLKVFDLRSYAAALGNRAKGGGCECTGKRTDAHHTVRVGGLCCRVSCRI